MRLALGSGALAALSLMAAGLLRFPVDDPATDAQVSAVSGTPVPRAVSRTVRAATRVRYIQLAPGQRAPNGATVIDAAAPTPRVVVRTLRVQAKAQAPAPRVRQARTRQSGRG